MAQMFGTAAGLLVCATASVASAQVPPTLNSYGPTLMGAQAAWAAGYNGAGVAIAVADTGVAGPVFAGKIDPRSMSFAPTANRTSAPGQDTARRRLAAQFRPDLAFLEHCQVRVRPKNTTHRARIRIRSKGHHQAHFR